MGREVVPKVQQSTSDHFRRVHKELSVKLFCSYPNKLNSAFQCVHAVECESRMWIGESVQTGRGARPPRFLTPLRSLSLSSVFCRISVIKALLFHHHHPQTHSHAHAHSRGQQHLAPAYPSDKLVPDSDGLRGFDLIS